MILGVELAELPEPYKVVALQNSLIKLYSHINWSKIFTSDQEVLFDGETSSVPEQRVLRPFKGDLTCVP